MDAIVKSPGQCTESELKEFQRLVEEGGEVTSLGLRERIEQAEALVFINEGKCIAVGAVKNPNQGYKANVFETAGVASQSEKYQFELGWIYVDPEARGTGLGHSLMVAVNKFLGGRSCYATTRESNQSMHHLFFCYGFSRLGESYQSQKGYSLVLYGNRP